MHDPQVWIGIIAIVVSTIGAYHIVVSGYAIQALSRGAAESVEAPKEEAVRELLDAVSNSQGRSFTATGEGEDVRIEEDGLSAAALVAKGRLIHLCGFRVN